MCVQSRKPCISESPLHSKLLVTVLANLLGRCSLNERKRQMKGEIHVGFRPEKAASDAFRRNWCKLEQQVWHWGNWEQMKATFPAVSLLYSTWTFSVTAEKTRAKQDRKTRDRGCDRLKKINVVKEQLVLSSGGRTVFNLMENNQQKSPRDIKKQKKSLRQKTHCEQCEMHCWNFPMWLQMCMTGTWVSFITWLIRAAYWAKPSTAEA